jgi:uncharacterized protein YndB with AHSA1/START domain
MEKLIMTTEITFKAAADKVWEGLTNPKIVKEYFFGTNLKSDFMVGSPITFSGEWEGMTYEDKGIILEIEPHKFLKYSYWSSMSGKEDKPENYAEISYQLIEDKALTTLIINQTGLKKEEEIKQHEQNWLNVFEGLKKIIE